MLLAAASCTSGEIESSQYHSIPPEGWLYGDTLIFTPGLPDSIATGHLVAAVSHDGNFAFSTLWLEVLTLTPRGEAVRDTISFHLADNFGRWKGNGLSGNLQMSDTITRRITLTRGQPVKVRHIMRADTLKAINNVGIFFIATD